MRTVPGAVALVLVVASIGGCSRDSDVEPVDLDEAIAAGATFTDDRPAVLERLGAPDSFQITLDEIDGSMVRFESWSYHDLGTRIDFADGTAAVNIEIDDLPDGSLLPLWYTPQDFELLITLDEAQRSAIDLSPAHQTPTVIDLSEGGDDYEEITVMVGDQILLAFVDGVLTHVETFVLPPDNGEGS
jgi:hypothetical protein